MANIPSNNILAEFASSASNKGGGEQTLPRDVWLRCHETADAFQMSIRSLGKTSHR